MYYVKRDADGEVAAVFRQAPEEPSESLPSDHPEIAAFFAGAGPPAEEAGGWAHNDLALARVLEDLISVLVEKSVIGFTDLPLDAQRKLVRRHGKRDDLDYVARLYPSAEEDELG